MGQKLAAAELFIGCNTNSISAAMDGAEIEISCSRNILLQWKGAEISCNRIFAAADRFHFSCNRCYIQLQLSLFAAAEQFSLIRERFQLQQIDVIELQRIR